MPDDPVPSRADLLATVERSPAAAAAHDRAGWVGLFTADGIVEDPVGSRPHRGSAALGRFYDTFIGPRDITFHRDADIVVGTSVIRDLVLEVAMSPALTMRIPAILRYDVTRQRDELKIARLQAYWQLPAMVVQFARGRLAAVPAGLALARALLANQGVTGTLGFAAGFHGVGGVGDLSRRGLRTATGLLADACTGNELAVRRRIGDAPITLGDGTRLSASELGARLAGGRRRKVISAGHFVAATVERDARRGVLIAQLAPRPWSVAGLQWFDEQ